MRRTQVASFLWASPPSKSLTTGDLTDDRSNCILQGDTPLRPRAEQKQLAVGHPVPGSTAAEPLSHQGWGRRRLNVTAPDRARSLCQGQRQGVFDHALL